MINRNNLQNWTPPKDNKPAMNINPKALIIFNSGKPFRIIEYVFNNIIDTYCKGLGFVANLMINRGYNLVCHEKEMMIEIGPFNVWLDQFLSNLISYTKSVFDDNISYYRDAFCFYVKSIKTDALEIILRDGEFVYKDEFGVVLNEQYLSTFLSKLTEIHPGIEIPELNWNYVAYYEKHN